MEFHKGEFFKLANNDYIIMNGIEYKNKDYVLLANVNDKADLMIRVLDEEEGNIKFPSVSEELFEEVLLKLTENMKQKNSN